MTDLVKPIDTVELRFPPPAKRLSENEARGMNVHAIARRLEPWQMAVRIAWSQRASNAGRIANVPCQVEVTIPFERKMRADGHNYTGTMVKAMVDALLAAGAWPDDSPEWVQIIDPILAVGGECIIRLIPRLAESQALGSRAVLRPILASNGVDTPRCGAWRTPEGAQRAPGGCNDKLTFQGWKNRKTRQQVICNVYVDGRWNHAEHWHRDCYTAAGEPYGKATA